MLPRLGPSLALAAILAFSALCFPEVLVLRDGTRISGKCNAMDKQVSVDDGVFSTTFVPRATIDHVELTAGEKKEFDKLVRDCAFAGADGEYLQGKWLDDHLQYDRADEHYRKAIDIDPDFAPARKVLGYRKEGKLWKDVAADQIARAMLGFGSSAADACVKLGKSYVDKKSSVPAEKAFRRALIADPYHKEALKLIAPFLADYKLKNTYRNPLDGKTKVVMGYDHPDAAFMLNAQDLVKVDDDGRPFAGTGSKLEDHYTFNAPVYAAASGEVFSVVDRFVDTPLGEAGKFSEANVVCIKHGSGEFTIYAHLKRGSVVVTPGQQVRAGTLLGRVGNSGSGAVPHLHFCIYDSDGISLPIKFTEPPATKK